jgi:hypothetical protein
MGNKTLIAPGMVKTRYGNEVSEQKALCKTAKIEGGKA